MNNTLKLFIGSLCLLASSAAFAADIHGLFMINQGPITVRDASGEARTLEQGSMAVRLSNQSRSATFKQYGRDIKLNVPVWGGGSNLRNFYLRGVDIGQALDMRGITTDTMTGTFRRSDWVQCNLPPYYCRGRYPCYGRQQVEEIYEDWLREFSIQFIDQAQSNQISAWFKSNGERFTNLRSRYPVGGCY